MAITLDSMVLNTAQEAPPRVTGSARADEAAGTFELSSQRSGSPASATTVQLSAFGQIKSSYADIQSAAHSLSAPGKGSSAEDTTKAVQTFAEAFNKAAAAVLSATGGDVRTAGIIASNVQANLAGADLKKIVTNGDHETALKKIGISLTPEGKLAVDTQALQNAIQADPKSVHETLTKLGAQAEQIAEQQLAAGSSAGTVVYTPAPRARNAEIRNVGQQPVGSVAPEPLPQQAASGATARNLATYLRTLAL